jgi:hypothetical protein
MVANLHKKFRFCDAVADFGEQRILAFIAHRCIKQFNNGLNRHR